MSKNVGKEIFSKCKPDCKNFDQQNVLNFYSNCEKQTSMSYIQIDGQSQKKTNALVLYSNQWSIPKGKRRR